MTVFTAMVSVSAARADDNESVIHNIHNYSGHACDEVLDNPSTLTYSNTESANWVKALDAWDTFNRNFRLDNDYPEAEDLIDITANPTGTDHYYDEGVDAFDIALVHAHGVCSCDVSHGDTHCGQNTAGTYGTSVSYADTRQDPTGATCRIITHTSDVANEVNLGDLDLELFYTTACHSMQQCLWDSNALWSNIHEQNLRMYAGFHGSYAGHLGSPPAIKRYVETSRTSGVGSHWLEELFTHPYFKDNCPVVKIWASDILRANRYFSNGGMQQGENDRNMSNQGVGPILMDFTYFVDGCKPWYGGEL